MPASITLTLRFDKDLQEITGMAEHPVVLKDGTTFAFLLMSILEEYPEIADKYPPGSLGFTVNEMRPEIYSPLFDSDAVSLFVPCERLY